MKVYRDRQTLIGLFFRGSLLFYVGIDNIIEGPLRTYLAGIFNLKEFGTNLREEYLYYLILVLGVFQLYVFLQNVFLPIVEVVGAKVLFRTPNAALSVVKNIDEIKHAEFNEEKILKLTFVKKSYDVNLKDVDENEVEELLKHLSLN